VVAAGLETQAARTAEPVSQALEQAVVVTPGAAQPVAAPTAEEFDTRPDFKGRTLPPGHAERVDGNDTVSADAAFGAKPVVEGPAGFSNLFGWRRDDNQGDNDAASEPETIVSSPDDHPAPASFDDSDLEIPAFLRRSANN